MLLEIVTSSPVDVNMSHLQTTVEKRSLERITRVQVDDCCTVLPAEIVVTLLDKTAAICHLQPFVRWVKKCAEIHSS
jgi:hypothetical protein